MALIDVLLAPRAYLNIPKDLGVLGSRIFFYSQVADYEAVVSMNIRPSLVREQKINSSWLTTQMVVVIP